MMDSILNAQKLRSLSEVATAKSRFARQHYVDGLREGVGDDELRHRHFDAMDTAAQADKAHRAYLGEKRYAYSV